MDQSSFLELCSGYTLKDIGKFKKAINYAQEILGEKKRISGDTFFEHNLRVGEILIANRSEPVIVLSGVLYGMLKYVRSEEIKKRFGADVLKILESIASLHSVKVRNIKLNPEAVRKIMLTTLEDVRVILIKLANKLDNLRSIGVLPEKEQKRIAQEVLEIYAPLANRLGADKMKIQLENAAFKILHPRKFGDIMHFLEESQEQREKNIDRIIIKIKEISKNKVHIIKIKGRPKHVYSIHKKITKRGVKLHQQFDLLGIRIIVKEIDDCYNLLGLLIEDYTPQSGTLKDYIANPKPNFYRSIHLAVKLLQDKLVEIQIRTLEMDEFAEEGVAAHWRYKGVKSDELFEKKISWLKNVLDLKKDHSELVASVKIDLFGDKIRCYTPKGDIKELPIDSTLLDFAYLVHEEVGNHAIGGRVNGKFVALKHVLKAGDVIEIITNKNQRPRRGWIKIVTSSKARQKIRKSLKEFEKLPAIHFRTFKPITKEELGVLTHSPDFPKASCVLAKCCRPIPGEDLVGIATKRRIISVHKEDCHHALKEEKRWVGTKWKKTFNQKIRFFVRADERSGLLADLLNTIARAGFEVKEAKAKLIGADQVECSFLVIPRGMDHLKDLIGRMMKLRSVKKVYFS